MNLENDQDEYSTLRKKIELNYDKIKRCLQTINSSMTLKKKLQGEIINSSILLNNINLISLLVSKTLEDLERLENFVKHKTNYKIVSAYSKSKIDNLYVLEKKIKNLQNLINQENFS